MKPAAAALPLELIDDVEVIAPAVAVRAVVGTIEAARHKIRARMLALAREIRKQREPVGYSAFVLFALLKNSAVCMWEGGVHVDLLDTFAPWAKDSETKSPPYAGIPCTLVATPGCMVECMPVSEKYPLRHIGHFVAGCPILGSAVAGNSVWLRRLLCCPRGGHFCNHRRWRLRFRCHEADARRKLNFRKPDGLADRTRRLLNGSRRRSLDA